MTSPTWKRIFISIDKDYKNKHRLDNGQEIRFARGYDNFNLREIRPVNGIVIQSSFIPSGAEVLLHHNCFHPTYEIFDYKGIDGDYLGGNLRYFSVPESECYAWRLDGDWQPCPGFEFGLRVFKPYTGALSSILPQQIKNKLFVTTGEYKNKVVLTKGYCDYEIIYQDKNGKEARLIRFRHFDKPNIREEIVAIDHEATGRIKRGEHLIGLSAETASSLVKDYAL